MLIRIVRMVFQPDKVDDFLENFHANKDKIRAFPGCHHLALMQDYTLGNSFTTYSHWADEAALDQYRHSALFKSVWANTKPLFAEKPVAFSLKEHLVV